MKALSVWQRSLYDWLCPRKKSAQHQPLPQFMQLGLSRITSGHLSLTWAGETFSFGEAIESQPDIGAHVTVNSANLFPLMLERGSVGAAEAYMLGHWSSPDLTQVVRIFARNLSMTDGLNAQLGRIYQWGIKCLHSIQRNSPTQAAKNITRHYDLGNAFFECFLDPTLSYSSVMYTDQHRTLHQAATYKLQRTCEKLQLTPDDHLLEIGSGWGGLALHAARHFGCRVTTTTISKNQYDKVVERVQASGLSDRITVVLKDYRELTGYYTKLVSIEMIEAVGFNYLNGYLRQCQERLAPNGLMLLQMISIDDQRLRYSKRNVDFIQTYIFPGGALPSLSDLQRRLTAVTDMSVIDLEDITHHYARTLNEWRERFFARWDDVAPMGFDNTFKNMWDYYFCYCEAGFIERRIRCSQLLLARPDYRSEVSLTPIQP